MEIDNKVTMFNYFKRMAVMKESVNQPKKDVLINLLELHPKSDRLAEALTCNKAVEYIQKCGAGLLVNEEDVAEMDGQDADPQRFCLYNDLGLFGRDLDFALRRIVRAGFRPKSVFENEPFLKSQGQPYTNWEGDTIIGGEVLLRLGVSGIGIAALGAGPEAAPFHLLTFVEKHSDKDLQLRIFFQDVAVSEELNRKIGGEWSVNCQWGNISEDRLSMIFGLVGPCSPIELKEKSDWTPSSLRKLKTAIAKANNEDLHLYLDDTYFGGHFDLMMQNSRQKPDVRDNKNALSWDSRGLRIGPLGQFLLSEIPNIKTVKFDVENLRIIFPGLCFMDRFENAVAGVQSTGLIRRKAITVKHIFEVVKNDRIVNASWDWSGKSDKEIFACDDCFLGRNQNIESHSKVCAEFGSLIETLQQGAYKIIFEGCDIWRVKCPGDDSRLNLSWLESEMAKESSNDVSFMQRMLTDEVLLLMCVKFMYQLVEQRTNVKLFEDSQARNMLWQGNFLGDLDLVTPSVAPDIKHKVLGSGTLTAEEIVLRKAR